MSYQHIYLIINIWFIDNVFLKNIVLSTRNMKNETCMQRVRDHLEKKCKLRIEYLKY